MFPPNLKAECYTGPNETEDIRILLKSNVGNDHVPLQPTKDVVVPRARVMTGVLSTLPGLGVVSSPNALDSLCLREKR